jgi:predicted dehydrogenase
MSPIGVGLIGTGNHGVRYARHLLADVPELRLVGIARRNLVEARRQAEEYRCRAFGDYRDLITAPEVEAVVVVVPPTLHAEIVEAAAAARRAVLLEKPATTTLAAGRRMLEAVRAAAIPLMVAQTLRFNGVVRRLLEELPQIGRIHAARISQRFEPSRPGWIDDPAVAGGGIVLHTGVHSFDLTRLFLGLEAERVSGETSMVSTTRTEDNFSCVIRFRDAATIACIAGSRATASRSGAIELAGEHGQLIGDHALNTAVLVRAGQATPLQLRAPVPTVREALRAFASALRNGTPMPIPLEEGLRAVALAEACYRSSAAQRAVAVEPL